MGPHPNQSSDSGTPPGGRRAGLRRWLFNDLSAPGAFEELRGPAADRVRFQMLENDSEKCRDCHVMEGIRPERKRGQRQHADAMETGTTCIVCHYNLVHKKVEPSEAFLEATEGR